MPDPTPNRPARAKARKVTAAADPRVARLTRIRQLRELGAKRKADETAELVDLLAAAALGE